MKRIKTSDCFLIKQTKKKMYLSVKTYNSASFKKMTLEPMPLTHQPDDH